MSRTALPDGSVRYAPEIGRSQHRLSADGGAVVLTSASDCVPPE